MSEDRTGTTLHVETPFGNVGLRHLPGVMEPSPFSMLLVANLEPRGARSALDMGCGSGLQAISLALAGVADVVAVDADVRAVEATEVNARLNNVFDSAVRPAGRVSARHGDLFLPVAGETFDLIVSNPPTFPADCHSPPYTRSEQNGRRFVDTLLTSSHRHLNASGRLQFVQSSLSDLKKSGESLTSSGFAWTIVAKSEVAFRPFYYDCLTYFQREADAGRAEFRVGNNGQHFETLCVFSARLRC